MKHKDFEGLSIKLFKRKLLFIFISSVLLSGFSAKGFVVLWYCVISTVLAVIAMFIIHISTESRFNVTEYDLSYRIMIGGSLAEALALLGGISFGIEIYNHEEDFFWIVLSVLVSISAIVTHILYFWEIRKHENSFQIKKRELEHSLNLSKQRLNGALSFFKLQYDDSNLEECMDFRYQHMLAISRLKGAKFSSSQINKEYAKVKSCQNDVKAAQSRLRQLRL
ncbi:MAG: hypothetical protein AAFO07_33190 [Bacteroidota bacterium]